MKNSKNIHIISSTLKTVASENLVSEQELANANDQPLKELLNEKTQSEIEKNDNIPSVGDRS
jgi:hypothetical protein